MSSAADPKKDGRSVRKSRPSKSGAGVSIDGPTLASSASEDQIAALKATRRKSAFATMGVGTSMKQALDDAMSAAHQLGGGEAKTPEQKLQAVMIQAKESGMEIDKIFKFFKGTSSSSEEGDPASAAAITAPEFGAALQRLSPKVFDLTPSELALLVAKFDVDGDGTISVDEFKDYCYYEIPALCWRAERLRMEKAGLMQRLPGAAAHSGHNLHIVSAGAGAGAAAGAGAGPSTNSPGGGATNATPSNRTRRNSMTAGANFFGGQEIVAGDRIYDGTKFFWKVSIAESLIVFCGLVGGVRCRCSHRTHIDT